MFFESDHVFRWLCKHFNTLVIHRIQYFIQYIVRGNLEIFIRFPGFQFFWIFVDDRLDMVGIEFRHRDDYIFSQDDAKFIQEIFFIFCMIFRKVDDDEHIIFIDIYFFLVSEFKQIFFNQFMKVIFFYKFSNLIFLWFKKMYPIYISKMQNSFHNKTDKMINTLRAIKW